MNENRVNELIAGMKSFGKEKYQKCELLPEMFALQQEMVALTFNGEHASTADLKIWDVERHLGQMNMDCGNVADEQLKRFVDDSRTFCNLIKAEISGSRGESKAFRYLQYVYKRTLVLKNVELSDGDLRTELDAVVITPECVTIIEVKNTAKNIFIDENGGYFRTGEYLKWDCNIAEKMEIKETLLRRVLEENGLNDVEVRKIVVFTNNRIEVQNKYPEIRTCFVSQLAYIIDGYSSAKEMSEADMHKIEEVVLEAEVKRAYPFDFDIERYKNEFATVMVMLEDASAKADTFEDKAEEREVHQPVDKSVDNWTRVRDFIKSKYAGYAGSAVAAAAITLVTTMAISAIRKDGI